MYEIEKREFLSKIFISHVILSKIRSNIEITIFQHTELVKIALYRKPGIIFLKSCPDSLYPYIKLLKKRGFKIILFQEEGLHYKFNQVSAIEFSPRCHIYIDHYMAWHINDAAFAKKMSIPEDRIKIIGNIRFELARKSNKPRSYMKTGSIKILVLENFTTGNLYKNFKPSKRSVVSIDSQEEFAYRQEIHRKNITKNQKIYQKLYSILFEKGYDFKIRRYTLGKENNQNLFLRPNTDSSINILEALHNSDVVIHYGSTAGLEAILNGCISIILETKSVEKFDNRIRNCSLKYSKVEDLVNFLIKLDRRKLDQINREQVNSLNMQYQANFIEFETTKHVAKLINEETKRKVKKARIVPYAVYVLFYGLKIWSLGLLYRLSSLYYDIFLGIANMKVVKANRILADQVDQSFEFLKVKNLNYKIQRNRKGIIFKN
jgi:surface carbohydrate biosynthesis protein